MAHVHLASSLHIFLSVLTFSLDASSSTFIEDTLRSEMIDTSCLRWRAQPAARAARSSILQRARRARPSFKLHVQFMLQTVQAFSQTSEPPAAFRALLLSLNPIGKRRRVAPVPPSSLAHKSDAYQYHALFIFCAIGVPPRHRHCHAPLSNPLSRTRPRQCLERPEPRLSES